MLEIIANGYNIHPSIAKGKMINAIRGLSCLLAELPLDQLSPETTCEKQGFLHPYSMSGGVGEAKASILLRDFATAKLDEYASLVEVAASRVEKKISGLKFTIKRVQQYRNMADVLKKNPLVVHLALMAHEQLGFAPKLGSIRGGTDGAQFSAMGLPTPNLSVGQHNIHSVLEFASLNQMTYSVEHAVELLRLWANHAAN
jgi:tripeptide aminopeptidase